MRKETHLDFTSLLDVIMILLFIVLASVGQRANITKDKLEEAQAYVSELEEKAEKHEEELRALELSKEDLAKENRELEARAEELSSRIEELSEEYEEYRALNGSSEDIGEVYERLLKNLKRVTMVCLPEEDPSSGLWKVTVVLYRETDGGGTYRSDAFELIHNFDLDPEARRRFNAGQELAATGFLEESLRDLRDDVCLLTLQYPENSENFSSLDIDILEHAVANVAAGQGLTFYIERLGVL